jgi:DNA-binding response OmpR family regulator
MFKNWFRNGNGKQQATFTVLVVSDDAAVNALICDSLTAEGCTIHAATTVSEAITLLDGMEQLPDVLIGDFHAPEVDGKIFLDKARTRFGKKTLSPVIFLMDGKEDEIAANALGVNDLLVKPFEASALLTCISKLAESRPAPAKIGR